MFIYVVECESRAYLRVPQMVWKYFLFSTNLDMPKSMILSAESGAPVRNRKLSGFRSQCAIFRSCMYLEGGDR